MNQAASAAGESPAGSTATASCCLPMFSNPFFMNTFASQAPLLPLSSAQPCFLGSQAPQIQPINAIQPPPVTRLQQHQQPSASQPSVNNAQTERSQQPQHRPQNHPNPSTNTSINNISTSYGTSLTAPALSLQHLLADRHSATNCMALAAAAALASASFPHFHQLQQQQSHLNHQQSSNSTTAVTLNQTPVSSAVTSNNSVHLVPSSTAATSIASVAPNQVPILSFNSYSTAPQNLNLPSALNTSQPTPVAAHLNHSSVNQQSNSLPNHLAGDGRSTSSNPILNNLENQQQQNTTAYRRLAVGPFNRPQQQQNNDTSHPAQNLSHVTRTTLSDEAFNSLFLTEQFQATVLLNQFLANNQFTTSLGPMTFPQQQTNQPQQLASTQPNLGRSQFSLPNQVQLSTTTAQVPASYVPHQRQEHPSSQQPIQQASQRDQITNLISAPNASNELQTPAAENYRQPPAQNDQSSQPQQTTPVEAQQGPIQQNSLQQQQTVPPVPFYPIPQVEQALALLSNPQVANNIFSQIFSNIYLQSGLRAEQHSHHNQSHHFHPHMHGHHHHHSHHQHGPNGQGNGQDASLPVDSLAINESKPKGLTRGEIDSLTHYIHTDEKDSRTCVICLSRFELKSKIRPLSCNHAFHAKCVDKWLRANRTCPICRRDALKTYEGKIKRI